MLLRLLQFGTVLFRELQQLCFIVGMRWRDLFQLAPPLLCVTTGTQLVVTLVQGLGRTTISVFQPLALNIRVDVVCRIERIEIVVKLIAHVLADDLVGAASVNRIHVNGDIPYVDICITEDISSNVE